MPVAGEVGPRNDPGPVRVRHVVVADARVDRGLRRKIPGEMTRIDIDAMDDTGHAEANNAVVVTRRAAAAAFPAVHPLAVVVVLVFDENGIGGLDQALLGGEELVARVRHAGAEARLLETNPCAERIIGCRHQFAPRATSRKRAIL